MFRRRSICRIPYHIYKNVQKGPDSHFQGENHVQQAPLPFRNFKTIEHQYHESCLIPGSDLSLAAFPSAPLPLVCYTLRANPRATRVAKPRMAGRRPSPSHTRAMKPHCYRKCIVPVSQNARMQSSCPRPPPPLPLCSLPTRDPSLPRVPLRYVSGDCDAPNVWW
jgi:hypothetical protein